MYYTLHIYIINKNISRREQNFMRPCKYTTKWRKTAKLSIMKYFILIIILYDMPQLIWLLKIVEICVIVDVCLIWAKHLYSSSMLLYVNYFSVIKKTGWKPVCLLLLVGIWKWERITSLSYIYYRDIKPFIYCTKKRLLYVITVQKILNKVIQLIRIVGIF